MVAFLLHIPPPSVSVYSIGDVVHMAFKFSDKLSYSVFKLKYFEAIYYFEILIFSLITFPVNGRHKELIDP